ncbi:MAG: multiheme c-type cytochrome [Planctomycetota bacterium]|jgi:hypothetical protein
MLRYAILLALLCALLAFPSRVWGVPDGQGDGDPTEGATYIGAKNCLKCHIKQHKTWKKMKHSGAWGTLPKKHRDGEQKDESGRAGVCYRVTDYGQAERERQARVILGDAENQIAQKFVEAAHKYDASPSGLHLRAMNILYESLKEKGTMVIVPSTAVESMGLGGLAGMTAYARQNMNGAPMDPMLGAPQAPPRSPEAEAERELFEQEGAGEEPAEGVGEE